MLAKYKYFILCSVLSVFLWGCWPFSVTNPVSAGKSVNISNGNTTFSNAKYGMSFSYPENLLINLSSDSNTTPTGASYNSATFGLFLYMDTITSNIGTISLDVGWPMSPKSPTSSANNTISILNSYGDTYLSTDTSEINGYTASRVYYTYTSSSGLAMKAVLASIYSNSTIYVVTATCQVSGFSLFQADVLNPIWSSIILNKGTALSKMLAITQSSMAIDKAMKNCVSPNPDPSKLRR